MKRQSTSKLLRLMVAVFALFLLVMAGSVLSACGGSVEEQPNNAEVHKHTYGAAEHTAIAKCGSTGYDVYTCTVCGDKYAIVTAATGEHDFNEQGVCKTCGLKLPADYTAYDDQDLRDWLSEQLQAINTAVGNISKPAEAHTHTFTKKDELTLNASCLSAGVEVGVCSCGSQSVLKWIDPLEHEYEAIEEGKKAATCTTPGQIVMECKVCKDRYVAINEDEPATGHNFQRTSEEMKLDKPANCITPKLLAYKCSVCEAIEYQQLDNELNSKRHSNSTDAEDLTGFIPESGEKGWKEWAAPAEGDTTTPSTTPVKPTSTLKVYWAKCPACDEIVWKTEEVPCTHTWKPVEGNIAATCETDGRFNAYCEGCGKYANQLPTSESRTESLTFDLTTEANAKKVGDRIEDNDGFVVDPATGHDFDESTLKDFYEVDRDPTTDKVITDSNNADAGSTNTTRWQSTTCSKCNHEIVVGEDSDGNEIVRELRRDDKKKPLLGDEYYEDVEEFLFHREWHAWKLYQGTETKEQLGGLTAPEDARGPIEATCLDAGLEWYYCIDNNCKQENEGKGRWIKIDLLPLGHIWGEAVVETAPTCINSGKVKYTCTRNHCGHSTIDPTTKAVTYDSTKATITFSIKSDKYEEIVGAEDWTWEAKYRTQEEGKDVWTEDYLKNWNNPEVWTYEASANCGTTDEEKLHGLDVLEDIVKKIMPQAHLWEKDVEATNALGTPECFDGHATVYKCVCKMNSGSDCCVDTTAEGDGKCPNWTEKSEKEHLKNADGELETGTYYIYGKCTDGGDSNEHGIIKVTYCLHCGYEISRENTMDKNHRHFPFNRKTIDALLEGHMPAEGKELGTKMSKEDVAARLEYANVWISIHEWWFMDNMDDTFATNLVPYLYTKSDLTGGTEGYQVLCYDCFNPAYTYYGDIFTAHACGAFKTADLTPVWYAYDAAKRQYIKVTDETKDTYNSCEYAYYIQYEKTCPTCGNTYRFANADGTGIGRYSRLTTEQVDGEVVNGTPTGEHYLIPAKDYWDTTKHANFKKDTDGTVTMDWVCVFCGKTFELNVKYDDGTTPSATDEAATTDTSTIKLVDPDAKLYLLVDTNGIKFGTKENPGLNERWGKDGANVNRDADRLLQMNNKPIFGKNINIKPEGEEEESQTGVIKNTQQLDYAWQGTVVMQADNDSTGIFIAHRRTNTPASTGFYFESNNTVWMVADALTGNLLRLDDFVDPTDATAYTNAWNAKFGITENMDANAKKAVNEKLDAMFKQGGEIVLGGNIGTVPDEDSEEETAGKKDSFGTLKDDGTTVVSKAGDVEKANVFLVPAGAEIDLNNHTFYGDPFVMAGTNYGVKGGKSVIKNGTIELEKEGRIQVAGEGMSLTLEGVDVIGHEVGLYFSESCSITIKDSTIITDTGFALSTNNAENTGKPTTIVLENSAFISKSDTAFFMSGEASIDAKGCEFYGYNMGVYLRGDNLVEEDDELVTKRTSAAAAAVEPAPAKNHARFVDCLFAKGNQASGEETNTQGSFTKHFGALTIGNDNGSSKEAYGSIKDLVLKNCDFRIVKVADADAEAEALTDSEDEVWTPAFDEETHGDLDLGDGDNDCKAECDTTTESKCTAENCCHRAIVINICGCSTLGDGEGHNCMTKDDECDEQCQSDQNGRVTIDMDTATFENLVAHAQKFSHPTATASSTINPFLGCTFTDGFELKGKCCKLMIYVDGAKTDFDWTKADTTSAAG